VANAAFGHAVDLAKRYSQANPNDLNWRREFYASQAELGNSLRSQGRWQEAANSYEAASLIAETLVRAAPDDAGFKRDLSIALEKKGHIFREAGDYPAALTTYQKSLDLARSLASSGEAYTLRDLGVALNEVAEIQSKLGKHELAAKNYGESIEILAGVVRNYPKDPEYRSALANSYSGAGLLAKDQGRFVEAGSYFQSALSIAKPLAESDSSNFHFLQQLLLLQGNYADFLLSQRKIDDALASYLSQIATIKRLIAIGKGSNNLRVNASATYYQLGEIRRCQGNLKAAIENFTAAAEALRGVEARDARRNLDMSRNRIALVNAGQSASCTGYIK